MGMMGDELALILLVADHPLFRDGFAQMVRVLRPHWTLSYAASSAEALSILSQIAPDLAIVDMLAEGHGINEIRHRLCIAERTVRAHLTDLFQLLGAHSRTQALIRARDCHEIPQVLSPR